MRIDFCVPIKNEAATLDKNLAKLSSFLKSSLKDHQWRIVGVINNSTDDSWQICRRQEETDPLRLVCLTASGPGKGRAIKEAWRASNAEILAFMDADLAVGLESIPDLINPLISQEADLVIASRFLPEAKIERSRRRAWMSQGYIIFSRLILGHHQSDLQCGFKAIKRRTFLRIENFLQNDFWFLDTELVILSGLIGAKIKEIPVNWQENRHGQNKSSIKIWRDSVCFILDLWRLKQRLPFIKKELINQEKQFN